MYNTANVLYTFWGGEYSVPLHYMDIIVKHLKINGGFISTWPQNYQRISAAVAVVLFLE
jgi:hypothetical protein